MSTLDSTLDAKEDTSVEQIIVSEQKPIDEESIKFFETERFLDKQKEWVSESLLKGLHCCNENCPWLAANGDILCTTCRKDPLPLLPVQQSVPVFPADPKLARKIKQLMNYQPIIERDLLSLYDANGESIPPPPKLTRSDHGVGFEGFSDADEMTLRLLLIRKKKAELSREETKLQQSIDLSKALEAYVKL